METLSDIRLRFPDAKVMLIVLLGVLLWLLVETGDAGAVTWENDYTVGTSTNNWEHVDSDGDDTYVAYIKLTSGVIPSAYARHYDGTTWGVESPVTGRVFRSDQIKLAVEDGVAHVVYVDKSGDDENRGHGVVLGF